MMLTKLKAVRLRRGLKLRDVSVCGVRIGQLSRFELRQAKVPKDTAAAIAGFLQTEEELFDHEGLAVEA